MVNKMVNINLNLTKKPIFLEHNGYIKILKINLLLCQKIKIVIEQVLISKRC